MVGLSIWIMEKYPYEHISLVWTNGILSMLHVMVVSYRSGCTVSDHVAIRYLVLEQPVSQCRASHPEMFGGFECLAFSIPATSSCFLHGSKATSRDDLFLGNPVHFGGRSPTVILQTATNWYQHPWSIQAREKYCLCVEVLDQFWSQSAIAMRANGFERWLLTRY